jgi:hypothetical protein
MAYGLTQSIDLNGSSQYLSRADGTQLSNTGNQTHEGWLWFDATPSSGQEWIIFSKYIAGANERAIAVTYENSGGTLRFHARTSANGNDVLEGTLNHTVTTGVWHHYAFVYSTAGNMQIFVDGSSIGTINGLTTAIRDNTAAYQIGWNEFATYFNGRVSLWRVWGAIRTDLQIQADMCNVLGPTTDLDAEWTLDNTLNDNSGNGFTLTNNGSATFISSVPTTCSGGGGSTHDARNLILLGVG